MVKPESIPDDAAYLRMLEQARRYAGHRSLRVDRHRLRNAGASLVARTWIDLVLALGRPRFDDPMQTLRRMVDGSGMIAALWHNRLCGGLLLCRHLFGRGCPDARAVTMISESADGDLVARLYADLGGRCIRGSSTRGGARALRAVLRELRAGGFVALTPDGPQGPKYTVHDGVIEAARLSQKPIIPLAISFGLQLCFTRSWDRFLVPLPSGRIVFHVGPVIEVPARLDAESRARMRERVHDELMAVTRRAESLPCRTIEM